MRMNTKNQDDPRYEIYMEGRKKQQKIEILLFSTWTWFRVPAAISRGKQQDEYMLLYSSLMWKWKWEEYTIVYVYIFFDEDYSLYI